MAAIERAARLARLVLERHRSADARRRAQRREEAVNAAARVIASAGELGPAVRGVLEAVATALGWDGAAVWLWERNALRCVEHWERDGDALRAFFDDSCTRRLAAGGGLPGRVFESGAPSWQRIVQDDPTFPRAASAIAAGLRAGFALPIEAGGRVRGALELFTTKDEPPDDDLARALRTVGLQLGQLIERCEAEAELRQTVRFTELFAGVLAHDLRNPLSSVVMGTHLLLDAELDPKSRRTLDRMKSSADRMTRMIEQLLDVTRARSGGGIALVADEIDLGELARALVGETRLAHPTREIVLERTGDLRGRWDGDRLGQVVSNLLGNAITHGRAEEPVRVAVTAAGERVRLEVSNGGTIPAEYLPWLFDPFRSGTEASRRGRGLGLGLYITKLIAEAHGGEVAVRSDGEGTTFRVELPRRPAVR